MMQSEPTPCLNCGAPVSGKYCSNCGQQRIEVRVSVGRLVRDALEDQLSVNSALPRTLSAMFFHPGRLTSEYLAGRIASYIPPFRLYLISSLLFFVLLSFLSQNRWEINDTNSADADSTEAVRDSSATDSAAAGNAVATSDSTAARTSGRGVRVSTSWADSAEINLGNEWLNARMRERLRVLEGLPPDVAARRLLQAAIRQAPKIVFLLLPVYAFLLKLLYVRRKRYYVEHFIFALHVHAFAFAVFFVMLIGYKQPAILAPLCLWLPLYAFMAMKRVYGQGWIKTFIKWCALGFAYVFLLSFGMIFIFMAAVFTI